MNKHRLRVTIATLGIISVTSLGLAGCGKSAQSQFTDAYFKETGDHTKSTTTLKLNAFKPTVDSTQVAKLFNKGSLTLTGITDRKKGQLSLAGKYKQITGKVVVTPKKIYISGDLIAAIAESPIESSAYTPNFDKAALSKIKGKYLTEKISDSNLPLNDKDTKETLAFQKTVGKAVKTDFDNFKKDTFKEKDGVISHQLTTGELTTILNSYNKVANSKKAYKDNKLSKNDISQAKDALKHYKITLKLDTKKKQEIMQVKGSDKANGISNLDASLLTKTVSTNEKVQVPSKSEELSTTDLQKAMQPKMSDSSFKSIFKTYKSLSVSSRKQYLKSMKSNRDYFTDKQWQQMSDLAK